MTRWRIRYTTWPRPALILTDTPRPDCRDCDGTGEIEAGTPDREEPDYWPCNCWDPARTRILLPLPRRLDRTPYSTEPPF